MQALVEAVAAAVERLSRPEIEGWGLAARWYAHLDGEEE